jgi:hypothetical protein
MAIDKITVGTVTGLQTELDNSKINPTFTGTEAAKMPSGTTAQRANVTAGDIRFNSTLSLMEYYDGSQWKSIDSPPVATSVSPSNFDTAGDTITITGSNFQSGATIKLVAADAAQFSASSVTFTNASTLSFDITAAMVADNGDPYDIVITNASGLSATMSAALDFAPDPAWTVAAGTLGTIYDSNRTNAQTFTTGATSTESDATITYAVTTGSLPSGLSIASSTGTITGTTSAVGSDTTVTFTITATATDSNSNTTTNTRQYSIVQKAPVIASYTSTGSGTFSVPTGITAVDVLLVGAGGSGGSDNGGGGGAGGLIYRPQFVTSPGGSISYTVGNHGQNSPGPSHNTRRGDNGGDTTFGALTAIGGGGGGSGHPADNLRNGNQGGSGGGSGGETPGSGGAGSQPGRPGQSGTYGFGTNGGSTPTGQGGAGGGGAVGSGNNGNGELGGNGGNGKAYSISGSSVTYAGGGGGGAQNGVTGSRSSGGTGGGGNGGASSSPSVIHGIDGTANRGGGGGGAGNTGPEIGTGAVGGTGIIIVKY